MTPDLATLGGMIRRSLVAPREGADEVLSLGIPRDGLVTAFLLVNVLAVFLSEVSNLITPIPEGAEPIAINPYVFLGLQIGILSLAAVLIHRIGRQFGGTAAFPECLLIVTWLQFVLLSLQVGLIVLSVLLPPLAGLAVIATFALSFWLLTNFVAAVHGFRSRTAVFFGIIAAAFGMAVILNILLAFLGVDLTGAA